MTEAARRDAHIDSGLNAINVKLNRIESKLDRVLGAVPDDVPTTDGKRGRFSSGTGWLVKASREPEVEPDVERNVAGIAACRDELRQRREAEAARSDSVGTPPPVPTGDDAA